MSRMMFAALLSLFVNAAVLAVAVDEKPLDDPALEAQARELMKEIRCLQCQNQSIEDSNADIARDLRALIRERIALGDSPENVKAYLVDRYGDWVLLKPPVKTSTYFLWGSPFLVVLIIAFLLARRKQELAVASPLSDQEKAQLSELLGRKQ